MDKLDLLPCPFCGNKHIARRPSLDFIACEVCGTEGPYPSGSPEKAWNDRSLPKGEAPEIPSQGSPGTREAVEARVFYRLVADGEVIPEDAESLRDDCLAWGPADRWTIGRKWGNHLMPMRTDGLRNRPFQAKASDGGQPREGKASPGIREATKGQMMMDVAVIDKLMAKGIIYPHEEEAWRRFKAVVEADNQEGEEAGR